MLIDIKNINNINFHYLIISHKKSNFPFLLIVKIKLSFSKIKTYELFTVRKLYSNGASEEDRTPISTLARLHTSHCTTPACINNIKFIIIFQVIILILELSLCLRVF